MKKTLVVFYSRTGHTRGIAYSLARSLDADLEEISEPRSRAGMLGYLRSAVEALRGQHPHIAQTHRHPGGYEQVVIGTPVWASHMSSPVRSYLVQHAADIRRTGLFCTYGGSGADKALAEMAMLVSPAPVATMAITDREIDAHEDSKLAQFVQALQAKSA